MLLRAINQKNLEEKISILSSQIAKLKFELSDNLKKGMEQEDLLWLEKRDEARESVVQLEKERDDGKGICYTAGERTG